MMGGVVPVVSSGAWVLTVAEDEDGDYQVQAITEDEETTGDGIDALEHRFILGLPTPDEVDEDARATFEDETDIVAVYRGVQIHTCRSRDEDEEGECELFRASLGEVEEDDVPEEVVEPVADLFSDEVFFPTPADMVESDDPYVDRELRGVTLVGDADDEQIDALGGGPDPDTEPGGMFQ